MRVQRASWTLSVAACLLTLPAVLTLARAPSGSDPAPLPDQRPPHHTALDFPHMRTGHANSEDPSENSPVVSLDAQGKDSKGSRDENWRHKTLRDDGTAISDAGTSQGISDSDLGNSRFGSGNPRLKLKTFDRDSISSRERDVGVKSTTKHTQQKPPQTSSLVDGNKIIHNNTSRQSETAVVTLLPPSGNSHASKRMLADDPGIVSKSLDQSKSTNSSRTESIKNGGLTVYPSPRKEFYQVLTIIPFLLGAVIIFSYSLRSSKTNIFFIHTIVAIINTPVIIIMIIVTAAPVIDED
ncbi:hypothetical protein ElyMa_006976600 [Elysia marginata]|uniref:G-protein coupled receptors family 1 profile domain-containing protein n=1 Tax=Elysia marginata TaxID=1093978 RepID=A0AAV4JM64_9GAST|nr:hypothetical protein ElyMa_006976600 [Elysia marginata]